MYAMISNCVRHESVLYSEFVSFIRGVLNRYCINIY